MKVRNSVETVDKVEAVAVKGSAFAAIIDAPGFNLQCELYDKDGNLKDSWVEHNIVTTEGRNSLLDVYFDGATQITQWYLGLISSVSWSAVAAGDVAAQINGTNGWKECSASHAPNYSTPAGTDRGSITFAEPSSGSLVSSATIDFTFSEAGTVKGAFIVSAIARTGTTGVLYSAAAFSADKVVGNGDQLKVTVTVGATAS